MTTYISSFLLTAKCQSETPQHLVYHSTHIKWVISHCNSKETMIKSIIWWTSIQSVMFLSVNITTTQDFCCRLWVVWVELLLCDRPRKCGNVRGKRQLHPGQSFDVRRKHKEKKEKGEQKREVQAGVKNDDGLTTSVLSHSSISSMTEGWPPTL